MFIIEKKVKTHTQYGRVSDEARVISDELVGCGTKELCSEFLRKTAVSSPYKWVGYAIEKEDELYTDIVLVNSWPEVTKSIEFRVRFCPEF